VVGGAFSRIEVDGIAGLFERLETYDPLAVPGRVLETEKENLQALSSWASSLRAALISTDLHLGGESGKAPACATSQKTVAASSTVCFCWVGQPLIMSALARLKGLVCVGEPSASIP
jgi:hypothetical protein